MSLRRIEAAWVTWGIVFAAFFLWFGSASKPAVSLAFLVSVAMLLAVTAPHPGRIRRTGIHGRND